MALTNMCVREKERQGGKSKGNKHTNPFRCSVPVKPRLVYISIVEEPLESGRENRFAVVLFTRYTIPSVLESTVPLSDLVTDLTKLAPPTQTERQSNSSFPLPRP